MGEYKSLTIVFASKLQALERGMPKNDCYIGTYNADWKIYKANVLLCDSAQHGDSDLYNIVAAMTMGRFKKIHMKNSNTVIVTLDYDYLIEFRCSDVQEDEMFHVRLPEDIYICYLNKTGWRIGAANKPWKGGNPI